MIEEIDPTRKKSEDMPREKFTDPVRLVFGRMKDGFHFFGVFMLDEFSKDTACAILSGCDYMITTDDRLLKYKSDKIKVVDPTEFIREMVQK